jgi:hypothetical protein
VDITSANGIYHQTRALSLVGQAGAPIIRLDPTPVDFGALPPGASGSASVQVHNDGDMDLVVTDIWRVAGAPDFIFDSTLVLPFTVPAGGAVTIGISTTAAPWPGWINTNEFEFRSNDPATPGSRLVCRVMTAGPRLEFRPDFIEFGHPPVVPGLITVTIYNRGSAQLDIAPIKIGGAPFSLVGAPAGAFSVAAGGSQSFDVQFNPTAAGNFVDRVAIRSNDALHPSVGIGVHGAW